ncbi:hypothetical protein [Glaciihabitans sp. UYNi722]|uniref:hypothetical protein n=1 Tax=Glaciihabitans sp. UYNi722 TaxID=3156344 RepID=UPI0033946D9E
MNNSTQARKRATLGKVEAAAVAISGFAVVTFWILLWSFDYLHRDEYCDVYCGPLPGLAAPMMILGLAGIAWVTAIIFDVVVLFIGRSRRFAGILILALFAVPLLSLMIGGWISR